MWLAAYIWHGILGHRNQYLCISSFICALKVFKILGVFLEHTLAFCVLNYILIEGWIFAHGIISMQ